MENGRMYLSPRGNEILHRVMSELELMNKRPETLRIAFAKGLVSSSTTLEIKKRETNGWEVPKGIIAKDDDYLLYRHLIIDRVGIELEAKDVDKYMLHFIEEGLEIMEHEMDDLTPLDNYLLFLVKQNERN